MEKHQLKQKYILYLIYMLQDSLKFKEMFATQAIKEIKQKNRNCGLGNFVKHMFQKIYDSFGNLWQKWNNSQ